MADNSSLPVASGNETFANEDISSVKYPTPKLAWGPNGTANRVDVASGKPLPAQIRSATGLIPIGEPTDAAATATDTTSVSAISLWKQISKTLQAAAAAASTALFTKVTDGTNTAAVKAASTAPVASDPALVVAMSPNTQNANGRASAANSTPVVLANEDKAALVDDAAFTPGTSNVNMVGFQADEASTDSVDEGDAGAARMTLDRKQIMTLQPHTAGGLSVFRSLDMDETEEDVKTSAGCLYKLRITNRTTSVRYVKLYNATAANVTVGSTTPIDTIPVPANASDYTVLTESFGGLGLTFDTALSIAATTGFADNDTGAPGTNDIIISAYYK